MKRSAGILLYRFNGTSPEVLLIHPGGPFWKNKDRGAWSVPKGEFTEEEDPLAAARREFMEETGTYIREGAIPLSPVKQKGGKVIFTWAVHGDLAVEKIESNFFEMEWPPRSGRKQSFPEIDKAAWFSVAEAKEKINPGQAALIDELVSLLGSGKGRNG